MKFADVSGREKRRRFPIRAYVGLNGDGKSLMAVHDLIPSIKAGRTILSTVPILDPETGELHKNYVPFTNWNDLLTLRDADVLMDEVAGVASARESTALPPQVVAFLKRLRKRDLTLSWTTPDWGDADKTIRKVTQTLTLCRGFFPVDTKAGASGVSWASKRLFRTRTYDAKKFEQFNTGTMKRLAPKYHSFYKREGNEAMNFYESLGDVSTLGWAFDAGMCMECGGRKSIPVCKCGR